MSYSIVAHTRPLQPFLIGNANFIINMQLTDWPLGTASTGYILMKSFLTRWAISSFGLSCIYFKTANITCDYRKFYLILKDTEWHGYMIQKFKSSSPFGIKYKFHLEVTFLSNLYFYGIGLPCLNFIITLSRCYCVAFRKNHMISSVENLLEVPNCFI